MTASPSATRSSTASLTASASITATQTSTATESLAAGVSPSATSSLTSATATRAPWIFATSSIVVSRLGTGAPIPITHVAQPYFVDEVTIAPSGDIVAIELVRQGTGSKALDEELMNKARRMKFDEIEKGNVTVTYAFDLVPETKGKP